jgi:hypothetical protein
MDRLSEALKPVVLKILVGGASIAMIFKLLQMFS